jgi:hypothetical protein
MNRLFLIPVFVLSAYHPTNIVAQEPQHRLLALQRNIDGPWSLPRCTKALAIRQSSLSQRFGIVVVTLNDPDNKDETESVLDCFGPNWSEVPTRGTESMIQIPTGEIFVKFRPNVSSQQIAQVFRDLSLIVVRAPSAEDRAFKVRAQPLSATGSLKVVEQLNELRTVVAYALPNWLSIHLAHQ